MINFSAVASVQTSQYSFLSTSKFSSFLLALLGSNLRYFSLCLIIARITRRLPSYTIGCPSFITTMGKSLESYISPIVLSKDKSFQLLSSSSIALRMILSFSFPLFRSGSGSLGFSDQRTSLEMGSSLTFCLSDSIRAGN